MLLTKYLHKLRLRHNFFPSFFLSIFLFFSLNRQSRYHKQKQRRPRSCLNRNKTVQNEIDYCSRILLNFYFFQNFKYSRSNNHCRHFSFSDYTSIIEILPPVVPTGAYVGETFLKSCTP